MSIDLSASGPVGSDFIPQMRFFDSSEEAMISDFLDEVPKKPSASRYDLEKMD